MPVEYLKKAEKSPVSGEDETRHIVADMLAEIERGGEAAACAFGEKLDGYTGDIVVGPEAIAAAAAKVTNRLKDDLKFARDRVRGFAKRQKASFTEFEAELSPGLWAGQKLIPMETAGCYVPGGQARYPSSVAMSVTPAKIAGVKRIVVVSPPGRDGKIDPLTIAAAKRCGATEIYKVGGAQAIGALAYGTKSIPKVDKIVGPGGKFVSIAKSLVSDQTAIDMVAGPTELGIIANASSDPELVALDLISQAEHSKDTMCFVITQSKAMAKQIQKSIEKLIPGTERSSIIRESISKNGFIAVCKNENEVIELANKIAPEHLELMVGNAKTLSKKITGAGLLLIGKNTPSAASDYILGTNHILPTNGFGRTRGGLSVLDFLKLQTVVESNKKRFLELKDSLKALTDAEGLPNHYKAVKRRLD